MADESEVVALRAALREAQDLISIAPAFFGFLTPEGRLTHVNDRSLDAVGASRDQVIGQIIWETPWWKPIPESARIVREIVQSAAAGNASKLDVPYWAIGEGSGETRWVTLAITPIRNSNGDVERIAATAVDITERRAAEQGVAAAREQLEAFFMQAPVPMVILMGPEFRFTLANPPYEKLAGKAVVGKTVKEVFNQGEAEDFIPLLEQVYKTGIPFIGKGVPFELPDENGTQRKLWLNFGYHPFRDASGGIQGVLALVEDVTELVNARHRVEESESELRGFIESMPQIAFITDPAGSVTFYNRRWYEYIQGMEETEGWGWKDKPILHPDDLERSIERWKTSVRTGEDLENEYRLRRHDGEYRWHLGRAIPIRDEAGRITRWVGTNTDIHDQKQLLRKLEEERDLRERFVFTLTHDLRTPMTAAKMSAQLLMRKQGDAAAVQRVAGRIVYSMDRADGMIRDLLDASRIGAGERLPIETIASDLTRIAEDAVAELSTIHGDRFVLVAPERIEGYWSRDGITRVLENLAGNAVKYGAFNRPVTIRLRREEDEAVIEVHNEGPAIPVAEQPLLFEPFRRAQSAQIGTQKGWGLGLTLVKGITEAHGGQVSFSSEEGAGTTFSVRLPLDSRRAGAGLTRAAASASGKQEAGS